ncbi:MAG TPA: LPS assembly lipoprotein LptE [Candidatus Fermentibacter daniensis]|nr:LPS assembly lipoprotein LptE [Candidatus Fermentibacter daniensis]HQM41908.1 LPS assembly lipoprotein LptE [Candidatus Fermentibacter daniensis]
MAASAIRTGVSVALLALASATAGCAYGIRGSLPAHLSTVRITPFRSSVQEYGLEQELNSLFVEEMVSEGRLSIVTASPDAVIECIITGFFRTPYSYSSSEQIEEYKLEIRASMSLTDFVADEAILANEPVNEWIVYDPAREEYSEAKRRLLVQTADEMARMCISGW